MKTMRKLLRWGWLPVIVAFGYAGWVLYSRSAENRRIESEHQSKRAVEDAAIVEKIGDDLKVVTFYANPPAIRSGDKALLCYGVVNAKSVRMEPPVEDVGPALSRCVEVKPAKSTTYTIIAEDGRGGEQRSVAKIEVQ